MLLLKSKTCTDLATHLSLRPLVYQEEKREKMNTNKNKTNKNKIKKKKEEKKKKRKKNEFLHLDDMLHQKQYK